MKRTSIRRVSFLLLSVVLFDGLFDGSPGGWNQILWRFSPGIYDVSPVEIFFNEYFHPGLLPDILAACKIAGGVARSPSGKT